MKLQVIYSSVGDQYYKHVFINKEPSLPENHTIRSANGIDQWYNNFAIKKYYFDDLPACILGLNDIQQEIDYYTSLIADLHERKSMLIGAISQGLDYTGTHVYNDQIISFNDDGKFHIKTASTVII